MLIYIHHTQTFNKWLDRTFMSELEEPLKLCKDFSNTGSKMNKTLEQLSLVVSYSYHIKFNEIAFVQNALFGVDV